MEVIHPKSSIKKVQHYDKNEKQVHAPHHVFYNYEQDDRLPTPTSTQRIAAGIPHRFNINDLKMHDQRLLDDQDNQ